MTRNFLKLNDSKTEFQILGSVSDLKSHKNIEVRVGNSNISPCDCARNIGAHLDSTLDMRSHVNSIIKACYIQLRYISKIRRYLTLDSTKKLIHAFVSSRLDNLNCLLTNLPDEQIKRLQLIQNNAARLVMRERKSCHITPILKQLHWLPVVYRIKFKIVLLVYKCLNGLGPVYLEDLLKYYTQDINLRSLKQKPLEERRYNKQYGKRAFAIAGPKLWNSLPLDIRESCSVSTFKSVLKTYFFRLSYGET